MMIDNKRVLITGGTGSLGRVLLRRLLSGTVGRPAHVTVFSRDEGKQHDLRVAYQNLKAPTDEVIYNNFRALLRFRIGDIRDFHAIGAALSDTDIVFNAAALKQVPTCEYFPYEAVATNVGGAENIVRAIRELRLPVETVIGISTDKAVKPVNVMGMTKAIQERIFIRANLDVPGTRFVVVRYGNVLASRGSVIPLFHEQIRAGGPVTITDPGMTRFLLSLEDAVDVVLAALKGGLRGETYIPRIPAARITDIAAAMVGGRDVRIVTTGLRPGEKLNEVLISEEEVSRVVARDGYYVIQPILPELAVGNPPQPARTTEYSSAEDLMDGGEVADMLKARGLMPDQASPAEGELLR
jgi:FlaA1/EpsC-like NDP-sugar epimerase